MLNKWLLINDQDKYTGRIFFTVREMYTVVKNKLADVPTSYEHFTAQPELKTSFTRFDKVIEDVRENRRKLANSQSKFKQSFHSSAQKGPYDIKIGSRNRDMTLNKVQPNFRYEGPPMVDTKAVMQNFLMG